MNKNKKRFYYLLIILLPFIIMFFLHIGIALSQYFNFTINVPNIAAKDWFMFCGSYLGGVMTLLGVIITIREGRSIHSHEIMENNILNEQEHLSKIISQIDIHIPSICYSRIVSIIRNTKNNEIPDFSLVYTDILNAMRIINQIKSELLISTNICNDYKNSINCKNCKNPCHLPEICNEFRENFDKVNNKIYGTLENMLNYIDEIVPNFGIKSTENKENDLIEKLNKIQNDIKDICEMNKTEIPKLIFLSKDYIKEREDIAVKNCFNEK